MFCFLELAISVLVAALRRGTGWRSRSRPKPYGSQHSHLSNPVQGSDQNSDGSASETWNYVDGVLGNSPVRRVYEQEII
jgi:hypothetical protein